MQTDPGRYGSAVEAQEKDGWTVTLELNGFEATLPEVVSRISEVSNAVVVYRSVNLDCSRGPVIAGRSSAKKPS